MRRLGLIYTEQVGITALSGSVSISPEQIRLAHERVTPIYEASGEVNMLEISPNASELDICAVLLASGISASAITGLDNYTPTDKPRRYSISIASEIGENVYELKEL